MAATFPPAARFHDQRDFSRVFQRQRKVAGKHVVLLCMRRPKRAGEQARLGVVVSAKTAPTAVRRHQLKRWVRELFRLRMATVAHGHDVVVLFRRDPPDDHPALDREILELLPRALAAAAERGPSAPPARPAPAPERP
jgi:ribonuclease P protein component